MNTLEYLKDRILDNPNKIHKGCALLEPHLLEIDDVLEQKLLQTMVTMFHRDTFMSRGKAALTNLSAKLGQTITQYLDLEIEYENERGKLMVQLGMLFIEAWHNNGEMIEILRDPDYEGNPQRAPYVVRPLLPIQEFRARPTDISKTPIEPISGLRQANKRPVMKRWGKKQEEAFLELLNEPFVDAVNVLQKTAWRVNEGLYEFLAPHFEDLTRHPGPRPETKGPAQTVWQRKFSQYISNKYTVDLATDCLYWDNLYFYVDLDWRGRVYYVQPFFNYQGQDLSRGLLEFSKGKRLGSKGLRWLKIHTACSFNQSYSIDELPDWLEYDYKSFLEDQGLTDISVDKMTLDDRARWTENHMESILFIGSPGGIPDCEKPIVFLACCLELQKLQDFVDAGGNPEDFVSHLPIPIDGTNNGWQHLGAISKDEVTGDLVGLIPGDVPKDFYVTTAKRLVEIMPEWFEERQIPMKHIRKGIAKRGSMTRAYSAGAAKIAENMAADLHQYGFDKRYNITPEDCEVLAKNLIKAINDVCPGPLQTMKFLQGVASHVISEGHDHISWKTPSGFPVKHAYYHKDETYIMVRVRPPANQPYHFKELGKARKRGGMLFGYTGDIKLKALKYIDKPNLKDTASGISPNFVHSMDASHMSLTIHVWGTDFGAVHDSFSVHASDVDDLMMYTRETFALMYSKENFFDEIERMIVTDGSEFVGQQPELGNLNIDDVKESDFFFA